jgi:predicted dienelactone hydrolase
MTDFARILPTVVAALFLFAPALARAAPPPDPVGFQNLRMPDGTAIGIWFPATGTPAPERLGPYEQSVVEGALPTGGKHPLVVMSHGTGGSFIGHYDTAIALARAGFVVAALTQPGDNYRDQSRATDMQARPVELSRLIGYMLGGWRERGAIDPARVGAFGFSSGGFTVLAAAGGRPDLAGVAAHCAAHPGFFDCGLLKAHPRASAAWQDTKDARIKAIVVAAPALGFAFGEAGLRAVDMPVQLWRADDDHILPAPYYADAVRAALPHAPEFHTVAGAGHFDFLAPCAAGSAALPICASAAGFDRVAFHRDFNAAVVRFLQQRL